MFVSLPTTLDIANNLNLTDVAAAVAVVVIVIDVLSFLFSKFNARRRLLFTTARIYVVLDAERNLLNYRQMANAFLVLSMLN